MSIKSTELGYLNVEDVWKYPETKQSDDDIEVKVYTCGPCFTCPHPLDKNRVINIEKQYKMKWFSGYETYWVPLESLPHLPDEVKLKFSL